MRSLTRTNGTTKLRRVWRKVSRERLLRTRAHGRIIPAPQRLLAHGRIVKKAPRRLGLSLSSGRGATPVSRRRTSELPGPALVGVGELGAGTAVAGLDLAEVGAALALADADDQKAGDDEEEGERAKGDTDLGAEAEGAFLEVVRGEGGDRRGVGGVDDVGREDIALNADGLAGEGLLFACAAEDGEEVSEKAVSAADGEAGKTLGQLKRLPSGTVVIRRHIGRHIVKSHRLLKRFAGR